MSGEAGYSSPASPPVPQGLCMQGCKLIRDEKGDKDPNPLAEYIYIYIYIYEGINNGRPMPGLKGLLQTTEHKITRSTPHIERKNCFENIWNLKNRFDSGRTE